MTDKTTLPRQLPPLKTWIKATVIVFVPLIVLADFAPSYAIGIAALIGLGVSLVFGERLLERWF